MALRLPGRRAIAAVATVTLLFSGTTVTVTAPVAFAQTSSSNEPAMQTPPAEALAKWGNNPPRGKAEGLGQGKLLVSPKVEPGGLLKVRGEGYVDRTSDGKYATIAFRPCDGANPKGENKDIPACYFAPKQEAPISDTTARGDIYFETNGEPVKHVPGEDGTFEGTIRIGDLEPGWYWIRNLAGTDDGKPALSKYAWFEVVPAGTLSNDSGEVKNEATVTAKTSREFKNQAPVVSLKGEKFTPGSEVSVKAGGKEIKKVKVGDDGSFTLKVTDDGVFPAGIATEVEVTDGTKTATTDVTGLVRVKFAGSSIRGGYPWLGATQNVEVANLPEGAEISGLTAAGKNAVTAPVKTQGGTATIPNVRIPNDAALINEEVSVTFKVGDKETTVPSGQFIRQSNEKFGVDKFEFTRQELRAGLYQSVYSAKENVIFVTRTFGRAPWGDSSIYKLDADTLKVIKEIKPVSSAPDHLLPGEKAEEGGTIAAYGVGLDETNDVLWITNTRHDNVTAYRASTLEVLKKFPIDDAHHSRDAVVDQKTGLAYISSASGNKNQVTIYDGKKLEKVGRIELENYQNVMSLDFDQEKGLLYAVSLNSPEFAKIDVRNGNKVTRYKVADKYMDRGSGITVNTKTGYLYIASQNTGNTIVFNPDANNGQGEVVANIATGAGALNATYDPKTDYVYVTNFFTDTISVIDTKTNKIIAQLPGGENTNHVALGKPGVLYVVNKTGTVDADGKPVAQDSADPKNVVTRITLKETTQDPKPEPTSETKPTTETKPGDQGGTKKPDKPSSEGSKSEDGKLKPGAIVGIIFGVIAAVAGLIGAANFFFPAEVQKFTNQFLPR